MLLKVESCTESSGLDQRIVSHSIISHTESLFEHAFRRKTFAPSIYVHNEHA